MWRAETHGRTGLLLALLSLLTTSCGSPDRAEPATIELILTHHIGDGPLFERTQTAYGHDIEVTTLSYVLAEMSLSDTTNGRAAAAPSVITLEATSEPTRLEFQVEPGRYNSLGLAIGSNLINRSAFETQGMWHPQGRPFELVSAQSTRPLAAAFATPLMAVSGERHSIHLRMDVGRAFAGLDLSAVDPHKVAANVGRTLSVLGRGVGGRQVQFAPALRPGTDTAARDATPPVLSQWPVPPSSCEAQTPCFQAFGAHPTADAMLWQLPIGQPVQATTSGSVVGVRHLEHSPIGHVDLFAVDVAPTTRSQWRVEHRFVTGVSVEVGDTIQAGDTLGMAGPLAEDMGRVALAVRRAGQYIQYLCPDRYTATASTAGACHAASLVHHQGTDWVLPGDVESGGHTYKTGCASCHGAVGQGGIAGPVQPESSGCLTCNDLETLAERIAVDMPPEGECRGACAQDVAAFIRVFLADP